MLFTTCIILFMKSLLFKVSKFISSTKTQAADRGEVVRSIKQPEDCGCNTPDEEPHEESDH